VAALERSAARADAEHVGLEATLWRVALLAGYGAGAREIARRLAAVTRSGGVPRASAGESRGRSCLEAGASVQLTVDAPGAAILRVGVRLADGLSHPMLMELMPAAALAHVRNYLGALRSAQHPSLGTWLFWSERQHSVFVDLRDPVAADALGRLEGILDADQRRRLSRLAALREYARPWALRVDAGEHGVGKVHLHWLIERGQAPAAVAELIAPGAWRHAVDVLGNLLRRPESSGRWVVATPLDAISEPALRLGNTGWALAPEEPPDDDRKHRAVAEVMRCLDGPRDYAEALWSMCRGAALPGWRVGRACELRVRGNHVRARLFFTPQT
jgi:hypothetical protein